MFNGHVQKIAKWISDRFYQEPWHERLKKARFHIKRSGLPESPVPALKDREIAVNYTLNILYYKPEGQDIKLLPIPEDLAELLREGFML